MVLSNGGPRSPRINIDGILRRKRVSGKRLLHPKCLRLGLNSFSDKQNVMLFNLPATWGRARCSCDHRPDPRAYPLLFQISRSGFSVMSV